MQRSGVERQLEVEGGSLISPRREESRMPLPKEETKYLPTDNFQNTILT